jgi:hypothetical protein
VNTTPLTLVPKVASICASVMCPSSARAPPPLGDDDVEAAAALLNGAVQIIEILGVGGVGPHDLDVPTATCAVFIAGRPDRLADLGGRVIEHVLASAGHAHVGALLREPFRDRQSDAGSYDGCLIQKDGAHGSPGLVSREATPHVRARRPRIS